MKRFVLAPDSFKGTLRADEVCAIWKSAILQRVPDAVVRCLPMADGGEGMVDSYLRILGGVPVSAKVSDPFGSPVEVKYGILPSGTIVMEMAACAGLPLIGERKDPMRASTYGVGEMILHACSENQPILLGLGGSATNDCGIGMAAALGFMFLDASGKKLEPLAANMRRVARIISPDIPLKCNITAACDVDNPLFGPNGATYTFGMQKGTTAETAAILDDGLRNMAEIIERDLGIDVRSVPGAGAAGGLGAGVLAFAGGTLKPGIDILLDAANFDDLLEDADMVWTGEGRIDWQSAHGKVPVGVSKRAKAHGIPCIALCGSIGDGVEAVYEQGITAAFSAIRSVGDFSSIAKTCARDLSLLADSVLRILLL